MVVGERKEIADGFMSLENCAVVRRWGTTAGLGQIAKDGPTENTILDATPPMSIPLTAIINTIECDAEKWREKLVK